MSLFRKKNGLLTWSSDAFIIKVTVLIRKNHGLFKKIAMVFVIRSSVTLEKL